MAGAGHKRRNVLIDANLQIGLSINMLGWLYFYVVMFALAVNARGLWSIFTGGEADPDYYDAVERLQWFTKFTVMPLAVMFVCVALHGVVFAHRVAGPVFRIKETFRDVANRRLQTRPVTLRPKDYFHDVAAETTKVIEALRADAEKMRRANAETLAGARAALVAVDEGRPDVEELRALARTALERAETFDRGLAGGAPAAAPTPEPVAASA